MNKKTKVAVTIDTDWASDEVMEYAIDLLLKYKVKTTWFITNDSNATRKLFDNRDIFEVGIHPNFLFNSTQGSSVEEIMFNLLSIHPQAKIMRTHSLYQSTPMFETVLNKFPGIKIDVSLFLPYEKHISSHRYYTVSGYNRAYIVRIPYIWEDDYEMYLPKPNFKFDMGRFSGNGIKIFDFHPIHIALNSAMLGAYTELRNYCPSGISKLKLKDVSKFRQDDFPGVENFLKSLLSNKSMQFVHIAEELKI